MKKHEFVLFFAGLSFKEREEPAVLLTYNEVWNMLEVFKKEVLKVSERNKYKTYKDVLYFMCSCGQPVGFNEKCKLCKKARS